MSGLRIGSLFSGYGGLDEGVRRAIGGEVAWHCEVEPAAVRLLAHHHPQTPNLGDITQVPWVDLEPVDVLTGGFPCQDVSSAGKRAGLTPDSRSGLWTHMARAIHVLRPGLVVIENVRGLLSADATCDLEPCPWCLGDDEGRPLRALGAVLGDLAVLGYDARWHGLRAADAGAPHVRYRVFITAWPAGADPAERGRGATGRDDGLRAARLVPGSAANASVRGWDGEPAPVERDEPAGSARGPRGRVALADTTASGWGPGEPDDGARQPDSSRGRRGQRSPAPDTHGAGSQRAESTAGRDVPARSADPVVEWGDYRPAIERWERELGRSAPAPTQSGARGGHQLAPRFVEFLMGLDDGHVTDVPGLSRNEQLKLLGNGVVPQQAELALRTLLAADRLAVAA